MLASITVWKEALELVSFWPGCLSETRARLLSWGPGQQSVARYCTGKRTAGTSVVRSPKADGLGGDLHEVFAEGVVVGGLPAGLYAEVFEQELGADARRLEDDGEAGAGVGSAAHEIHALDVFEAVVRAEVEHLGEAVGHGEGGAFVEIELGAPAGGGEDALGADARFQIRYADLLDLFKGEGAEAILFFVPIDGVDLVGDGEQDVEGGVAVGGEGWVGDRGVLDVERGILREAVEALDVAEVLLVVLGEVDGVVGYVVVAAFDAEIEHEGRAAEALALDALVGPAFAVLGGEEFAHGIGEVGVDDDGVGFEGALRGADAAGLAFFDQHLFDGLVKEDFDAHVPRNASHGRGNGTAAANRMKDAVLILEEAEDGEERGAAEGAHPQVLGLEAEAEADALVLEVAAEIAVEGGPWLQEREKLQHLRLEEVGPGFEGGLQKGQEAGEFLAIAGEEAAEGLGVVGGDAGDLGFHALDVGRGIDLAARAEDEAVLRIEAVHGDLAIEVVAGVREDFFENAGVEEEGRADVEFVAVLREGGGAAADAIVLFDDGDSDAGAGEKHGGGEASGASAYDDDVFGGAGFGGRVEGGLGHSGDGMIGVPHECSSMDAGR